MGFILKIYLLGLIAFVPSRDGRQMTVLVTDAGQGFTTSDGTAFPPHYPVLLASAASCQGDCTCAVGEIGPHIYLQTAPADDTDPVFPSSPNPVESLWRLVAHGGVWNLQGSQVSFAYPPATEQESRKTGLQIVRGRRPSQTRSGLATMPAAADQAEDFSWVAEMGKIAPTAGPIDPDCLARRPKRCPISSRMTVTEGTFKTHKLATYLPTTGGGGIAEFKFQSHDANQPSSDYTQAIADWTAVEIRIPTCEVTFTALPFDGKGKARRMTLHPSSCDGNGIVEVALLNLPDPSRLGEHTARLHEERQGLGSHFEVFYELAKKRPAPANRPIPIVTGKYLPLATVGQDEETSPLLQLYGLPRSAIYSRPICTQAVFTAQ